MKTTYLLLSSSLANRIVILVLLYEVSLHTLIHPSEYPHFIADVEDSLNVDEGSLRLCHDAVQFKLDVNRTTERVISAEHCTDLAMQIGSVQAHAISSSQRELGEGDDCLLRKGSIPSGLDMKADVVGMGNGDEFD